MKSQWITMDMMSACTVSRVFKYYRYTDKDCCIIAEMFGFSTTLVDVNIHMMDAPNNTGLYSYTETLCPRHMYNECDMQLQ